MYKVRIFIFFKDFVVSEVYENLKSFFPIQSR